MNLNHLDFTRRREGLLRKSLDGLKIWLYVKPFRSWLKARRTKMINYPTSLSLECVQNVMEIVKDRAIAERKQQLGLCLWNLQGYGMRLALGTPMVGENHTTENVAELEENLTALHDTLMEASTENRFGAESEEDAQDIGTILAIVSVVLQLLRSLGVIKRKNNGE